MSVYMRQITSITATKLINIIAERAKVYIDDTKECLLGETTDKSRKIMLKAKDNKAFFLIINDEMMKSTRFFCDIFPSVWKNVDGWNPIADNVFDRQWSEIIDNWDWIKPEDDRRINWTVEDIHQEMKIPQEVDGRLVATIEQQINSMPPVVHDILGLRYIREVADCVCLRMYDKPEDVVDAFRNIILEQFAATVRYQWPESPVERLEPVARRPRKASGVKRAPRRKDKGGETC